MNPISHEREEFLTIIAPTAAQAMEQFRARDLGAQGYLIAGRVGRHHFSMVDGDGATELFAGNEMVAATFSRKVPA